MPARSFKTRARRAARMGRTGYANVVRRAAARGVVRMNRTRASASLNVHKFSRYALGTSVLSMGDGVQTGFSNNHVFTLSSLVNATEFGQLFDLFRIDKVIVTYRLINNPDANNYLNSATTAAANWYPTVWSINDYDDNAPENISEMKERIGVKNRILYPNKKMKFVVRPKVLVQTYRTALTTGYAPKSLFVDMATQDIPHYGLKTTIDFAGVPPTAAQQYKIVQEFQYFFTCKNVR